MGLMIICTSAAQSPWVPFFSLPAGSKIHPVWNGTSQCMFYVMNSNLSGRMAIACAIFSYSLYNPSPKAVFSAARRRTTVQ